MIMVVVVLETSSRFVMFLSQLFGTLPREIWSESESESGAPMFPLVVLAVRVLARTYGWLVHLGARALGFFGQWHVFLRVEWLLNKMVHGYRCDMR